MGEKTPTGVRQYRPKNHGKPQTPRTEVFMNFYSLYMFSTQKSMRYRFTKAEKIC